MNNEWRNIKFGLRRALHHASRRQTCLSLLILCVLANWMSVLYHLSSHASSLKRGNIHYSDCKPAQRIQRNVYLDFSHSKFNHKLHIRRKIYDRHWNSLTNNITFEALRLDTYGYVTYSISILQALLIRPSHERPAPPTPSTIPHTRRPLIEWGAGIVSQNETINCATAIPPYMDNTFVYGHLTRLQPASSILHDSRNLCSLALVSEI